MVSNNALVTLLAGGSSALAILQSIPVPNDVAGPVEHLTLVGALVVTVVVLWRSNQAKDAQIAAMSIETTKTNTLVLEAVKESRKATEELGAAMDNLAENVAALSAAKP